MKVKKSSVALNYEEAYKQHIKKHKANLERSGFKLFPEKEFNRKDRSQENYKVYERQFRNSLMMKHGFKIAALQIEEEDLALYCFSLLQAEAQFPIKIFTVDHPLKSTSEGEKQSKKDLWMETHILVSSLTNSSLEESRFQTKIHGFFNDYLLRQMREFMKRRINWDYMVTKEYTDEKVIVQFQKQIIQPANEKFSKLFA